MNNKQITRIIDSIEATIGIGLFTAVAEIHVPGALVLETYIWFIIGFWIGTLALVIAYGDDK